MSARLSISSWSLHRALGSVFHNLDGSTTENGDISLLELPAKIAERGIKTLEICHFHFPQIDDDYIDDLRISLDDAGVELFSILIDEGDITHPDPEQRQREMEQIRFWIEIAGKCGAGHARVIAGCTDIQTDDAHHHETIQLSAKNLASLAKFGKKLGVKVTTENFRQVGKRADHLLAILDLCPEDIGLCVDFGNFKGDDKYTELAAILPKATSVHAKAEWPVAGEMLRDEFTRCMNLATEAGFDGPYSLIFDSDGSEWDSLTEIQGVVTSHIN